MNWNFSAFRGFNSMIHPRAVARLGETDGTEIQHIKIIRLCGRSPSETSSYVLNKAARRCVTSCGIKDSCGVYGTPRPCIRPFRKEICFLRNSGDNGDRRDNPETGAKPASLCLLNRSPLRTGPSRIEIFFRLFFYSWRDAKMVIFRRV